ncbi:MAG: alpha/beta hydrolase family protein [Armatimonadota bacterium]
MICIVTMLICLTLATTKSLQAQTSAPTNEPNYKNGRLETFKIKNWQAYVIVPTGKVDKHRRWVMFSPGWMVFKKNDAPNPTGATPEMTYEHQFYVEEALAKGFHVVAVESGPMLGSPAGAALFQELYEKVVKDYRLNRKTRLVGQSNGGLMVYAWAFRHPQYVDRILGIYPATDFRSWPGLDKVVGPDAMTPPGLGYGMTREELEKHISELNPIDNVKPLAAAGVKILHLHGDADNTVPLIPNSEEFAKRYRDCGGKIEIEVIKGVGHSPGPIFYQSQRALKFLLG